MEPGEKELELGQGQKQQGESQGAIIELMEPQPLEQRLNRRRKKQSYIKEFLEVEAPLRAPLRLAGADSDQMGENNTTTLVGIENNTSTTSMWQEDENTKDDTLIITINECQSTKIMSVPHQRHLVVQN